ncbi:pyridoxamine 5'-phosphate oxidase family protein [Streptomyces capparidis]
MPLLEPDDYPWRPTARTQVKRLSRNARYDRRGVHAILDEGFVCHVGFVSDGAPVVLPTLYGRTGDRLYLHGAREARLYELAARSGTGGLPVCLTVTLLDSLVLARSAFQHTVNHRSVVVHGNLHPVTDDKDRYAALACLVDHVVPGRWGDTRRPGDKELSYTGVLRLDLNEVSAKVRHGGPRDETPEDIASRYWAGALPVGQTYGPPVPADNLDPSIPVPPYSVKRRTTGAIGAWRISSGVRSRAWQAPLTMRWRACISSLAVKTKNPPGTSWGKRESSMP